MTPTNPLRDNLRIEATPGPTTLVIFGASGDLTQRKLLPAIYHLARNQRLPPRFAVIGVGRTPMDDDGVPRPVQGQPARVREGRRGGRGGDARWRGASSTSRASSTIRRSTSGIKARLDEIDGGEGVLHYLAIPPGVYATVIKRLGEAGLS